ncbi:hypothetical protein [Chryseobacterium sp. 18068]|uniref:hypothetical protein n=1 Tax=Chryseobacterium sp. 18068 TaxID=2681414 RepID=UPI00135A6D14|nr:hypothetical protein [Chryseobacterium sp. 18068]
MSKKYNIKGVDLKTELIIALSIIPFFLLFSVLSLFLYNRLTGVEFRNIPFYIVLGGMILGIVIGLLFAKALAKKMNGVWKIEEQGDTLEIVFKQQKWKIGLNNILKFKIFGNSNFKYISIFTADETIRMRIGNSGLTPFSAPEDLIHLDSFIKEIQPYFDKNYSKKDGTVKQSPPGTVKLTYLKK